MALKPVDRGRPPSPGNSPIDIASSGKPPKTRDDPGGDIVTVIVMQNGIIDYKREGVLTELIGNGSVGRYKTDDGDSITHNRSQGAKELARKLLIK